MKATGIVRRIDDLGRIVVPKEIRRTLRIREGDPLEIFTDREGEIILKKYSPIGELSQFAGEYAESLSQTTGYLVMITDCDHVVAVSGAGRRDFESKPISKQLEDVISNRRSFIASKGEAGFIKGVYEACNGISIDYGVMEKTDKSWVFEASFGWSDLGTWHSLYCQSHKDDDGNMIKASAAMMDGVKDSIVVSEKSGKLMAIKGLENYMVVDTEDVLMICPRDEVAFKNVITDLTVNEMNKYQ